MTNMNTEKGTGRTAGSIGNSGTAEMDTNQLHIERLRRHGAKVRRPDGTLTELNSFWYYGRVDDCIRCGAEAVTYELFLPDVEADLRIAIWHDGHVDCGSAQMIDMILDR